MSENKKDDGWQNNQGVDRYKLFFDTVLFGGLKNGLSGLVILARSEDGVVVLADGDPDNGTGSWASSQDWSHSLAKSIGKMFELKIICPSCGGMHDAGSKH